MGLFNEDEYCNGIYFLGQEQIAYFLTQEAVHLLVHFKFLRVLKIFFVWVPRFISFSYLKRKPTSPKHKKGKIRSQTPQLVEWSLASPTRQQDE